ncbi:RNA polymerase II transcription factor B subunit 1 [Mycoemilia scoparia]|uniref:RNA polymerase II transcription factor B subunit 1 n=1 Tax=Mycoemilia scoparia TaxID=417184 RepID=A0A9W7ZYM5_9FUNG|nr:RNA polymerase II transcription factor B subunit 1 [Mycoemilia scoparia]
MGVVFEDGEVQEHKSTAFTDKKRGTLYLTDRRIIWIENDAKSPSFNKLWKEVTKPQPNKPDSKTPKLRVTIIGSSSNEPHITFTWINSNRTESIETRDKVKQLVLGHTQRAAEGSNNTPAEGPGATQNNEPRTSGRPSNDTSVSASAINEAIIKVGSKDVPPEELELRKIVLSRNRDLARLHKNLVIRGLINEDEFWNTRRHLLDGQTLLLHQKKGPQSSLLELAPATQDNGDFKYTLTPETARKIFKQYPQVRRAYIDNVPHKVTEKQFWKRFFASRIFNRNRSATVAMKADRDDIFDKCLEEEDQTLNSMANIDSKLIFRLLDLTQTEEDGAGSFTFPDFTMKPAKGQENLSLIRRFNRHSQQVLKDSVNVFKSGENAESDPLIRNDDEEIAKEIEIKELEVPSAPSKIRLNITDQSRYFESQTRLKRTSDGVADDYSLLLKKAKQDIQGITPELDVNCIELRIANEAMNRISETIQKKARQNKPNRLQENTLPKEITRQISSCHNLGSEMLRHLWVLMNLPPTNERLNRATKVAGTLKPIRRRAMDIISRAAGVNPDFGSQVEKPQALEKYTRAFQAAVGRDSKTISGSAAGSILAKSGLPKNVLHSIWELSDIRQAGALSFPEFALAMFLAEAKIQNKPVPSQLPQNIRNEVLQATNKLLHQSNVGPLGFAFSGSSGVQPSVVPTMPTTQTNKENVEDSEENFESRFPDINPSDPEGSSAVVDIASGSNANNFSSNNAFLTGASTPVSLPGGVPDPLSRGMSGLNFSFEADLLGQRVGESEHKWAISPQEKAQYEVIFRKWDLNCRGFLSGDQAREVFTQSGLSKKELGKIWQLSDIHNQGKLNLDEFAVAMHLIFRRLAGQPLPNQLPPDLVPKSSHDFDLSLMNIKEQLMFRNIGKPKSSAPNSRSSSRADIAGSKASQRAVETAYDDDKDIPTYKSSRRRRKQDTPTPTDPYRDTYSSAYSDSGYNQTDSAANKGSVGHSIDDLKRVIETRLEDIEKAKERLATSRAEASQKRLSDKWKIEELKKQIRDLHISTPDIDNVIQELSSPGSQEAIKLQEKRSKLIDSINLSINSIPALIEDYEDISKKLYEARNELAETRKKKAEKEPLQSPDGTMDKKARAALLLAQRMQALTGKSFSPAGSAGVGGGASSSAKKYQAELEESQSKHDQEIERLGAINHEMKRIERTLDRLKPRLNDSDLITSNQSWDMGVGIHNDEIKALIEELSTLKPKSVTISRDTDISRGLSTGTESEPHFGASQDDTRSEKLVNATSSEDRKEILKDLARKKLEERMSKMGIQRASTKKDSTPDTGALNIPLTQQKSSSNPFESSISLTSPFEPEPSSKEPSKEVHHKDDDDNKKSSGIGSYLQSYQPKQSLEHGHHEDDDDNSSIGTSDSSDSDFETPNEHIQSSASLTGPTTDDDIFKSVFPDVSEISANPVEPRTKETSSSLGFLEHDFYSHRGNDLDDDNSSSSSGEEDWLASNYNDPENLEKASKKDKAKSPQIPDSLLEKLNSMTAASNEERASTSKETNLIDAVPERPRSKSPTSEAFHNVQQTLSSKLFGSGDSRSGRTVENIKDDNNDEDSWTDASLSYSENSTPVHLDLEDLKQSTQVSADSSLTQMHPSNPFAKHTKS